VCKSQNFVPIVRLESQVRLTHELRLAHELYESVLGGLGKLIHTRALLRDTRDDHYPVCRLDIWQDSEFATGYGYPKTAFKREPDTDPDIRNASINISRIQTFGKSCTLHYHSFIIYRSIFSAFCAMTPSLSIVYGVIFETKGYAKFVSMNLFLVWQDKALFQCTLKGRCLLRTWTKAS